MTSRFERIQQIVLQALEQPAETRSAWVVEACEKDSELLAEVQSLLQHETHSGAHLHTGGISSLSATLPPPEKVGVYTILERLGEGGFGEVFVAEQREPFRRKVALKILKRGMDTRAVLARFSAERQALALMEHPNISTILDAGESDSGRPYFVMEWIRGSRITDYCNLEKLGPRPRLELFLDVCSAIEHAHSRGVIHRDIKPSNVMIALVDGKPSPRVIDFGIAKAVSSPLTDQTLFTAHGQVLGTPAYMSPEQANPGTEVDVTTDVYSLGALLYELLVGVPPFDPAWLSQMGPLEIPRALRDTHPTRPSDRLSELVHSREATADGKAPLPSILQSIPFSKHRAQLAEGLDWIVLRALEREPQHRYDSVSQLADDIRCFLDGGVIAAVPPSWTTRSARWTKRKLHGAAKGTSVRLARFGIAVTNAFRAQRIAEERDRARVEMERAERVADFLARALASVEPSKVGESLVLDLESRIRNAELAKGHSEPKADSILEEWKSHLEGVNLTDVALRVLDEDILERAVATIDEELGDDPQIAARIRATFGATYRDLGLYEKSEPNIREALTQQVALFGEDHIETIRSFNSLSQLLQAQEKWAEAETNARATLDRADRVLGHDAKETLLALANLGSLLTLQGKLDEAEAIRLRSMNEHLRVLGEDHFESITAIGNLGVLRSYRGDTAGAEPLFRRCLELSRKTLGAEDSMTMTAMSNLAQLLDQIGRPAEAEEISRQVLRSSRHKFGDLHQDTLVALINLGATLDIRHKYNEAATCYSEAFEGLKATLGEDHSRTMAANNNLGCVYKGLGQLDKAAKILGPGFERTRANLGPDHLQTLIAMGNYGDLLRLQGNLDEAQKLLAEAIKTAAESTREDDWLNGVLLQKGGACRMDREEFDLAEPQLLRAHQLYLDALGASQWRTLDARADLRELYTRWGRPTEAATWTADPASTS